MRLKAGELVKIRIHAEGNNGEVVYGTILAEQKGIPTVARLESIPLCYDYNFGDIVSLSPPDHQGGYVNLESVLHSPNLKRFLSIPKNSELKRQELEALIKESDGCALVAIPPSKNKSGVMAISYPPTAAERIEAMAYKLRFHTQKTLPWSSLEWEIELKPGVQVRYLDANNQAQLATLLDYRNGTLATVETDEYGRMPNGELVNLEYCAKSPYRNEVFVEQLRGIYTDRDYIEIVK